MTRRTLWVGLAAVIVVVAATITTASLTTTDISRDEAEQIVKDEYKHNGKITDVTKKTKLDKPVYRVTVDNPKQGDIPVDVERSSGKIVADDPLGNTSGETEITQQWATSIARDKYGGKSAPPSDDAALRGGGIRKVHLQDSSKGNMVVTVDTYDGHIDDNGTGTLNNYKKGDYSGKYGKDIAQVLDYERTIYPEQGKVTRDTVKIWVFDDGEAIKIRPKTNERSSREDFPGGPRMYDKGELDFYTVSPDKDPDDYDNDKADYTVNG